MSSKTAGQQKKKAQPVAAAAAANGAPTGPVATDCRVAQQLRVLEAIGANKSPDKEEKKFSPRTEKQIAKLMDVLDFFGYSRNDIAALVRRCHYDDQQIQIAVANIIEDKANHESDSWGEVKTKKQIKEEKAQKEEEERKEQERIERELEKQRKQAEKRAQKERDQQWNSGYSNQGHRGGGEDPAGGNAVLPPDPAILFAGPKPTAGGQDAEAGKGDWWNGVMGGKWDGQNEGKDGENWDNGKDWQQGDWQAGQDGDWQQGEWPNGGNAAAAGAGSNNRGDDAWWQGDWEKAGGSKKNAKRGQKEKGGGAGAGAPGKKDATDLWDMPETAGATEGGLDQWTLGDIHKAEDNMGPTQGSMRTVEDLEREAFGADVNTDPAMGSSGKSAIDMLLNMPDADGAPAERSERGRGRGRGRGDDRDGKGGKGGRGDDKGGKGDKGDRGDRSERVERDGGKGDRPRRGGGGERSGDRPEQPPRVERPPPVERDDGGAADRDKEKLDRIDRSEDPRRQPMEEIGDNVTVKKHSSMGCAVVSLRDPRVREAIVRIGTEVIISGIKVQMKPHFDKETKVEVMTDIFVAWGRQVEKTTPLSERELTKFFDQKHQELTAGWNTEATASREAEERVRNQKLLEEQQRQVAEQRQREDQRRAYEEDLIQRRTLEEQQQRQIEAQRKMVGEQQEQQRRQEEQRRMMLETQTKFVNDQLGINAGGMGAGPAAAAAAAAAARQQQAQTGAAAGGAPATATADQMQAAAAGQAAAASGGGLNAAAAAYPAQAAAQWGAAQQWMQAMAYHSQQGAAAQWQQQMAQRGMQQQMAQAQMQVQMQAQMQASGQAQGGAQDYETLRAHAAYYAYMQDQQRGQGAAQAAAYAQAAQAQQGGYPQQQQQPQQPQQQQPQQPNAAAYGYGAAAANYGRGGGDRI